MKKLIIAFVLIFTLAALAACTSEEPIEPGTITGSVYLDCNQNEECDCDDIGFANVDIQIFHDQCGGVPLQTINTDDDGNFEFTGLEPGTYCVMSNLKPNCDVPYPFTSITQVVELSSGQLLELEKFGYSEVGL
jgi:hypothetical protein